MNFFGQSENATDPEETISKDGVYYYSEEDRKMARMREKRIKLFMQMELKAFRDELDWLIRCHNCAADNCTEEEYPSRPLSIPPKYIAICRGDWERQ